MYFPRNVYFTFFFLLLLLRILSIPTHDLHTCLKLNQFYTRTHKYTCTHISSHVHIQVHMHTCVYTPSVSQSIESTDWTLRNARDKAARVRWGQILGTGVLRRCNRIETNIGQGLLVRKESDVCMCIRLYTYACVSLMPSFIGFPNTPTPLRPLLHTLHPTYLHRWRTSRTRATWCARPLSSTICCARCSCQCLPIAKTPSGACVRACVHSPSSLTS